MTAPPSPSSLPAAGLSADQRLRRLGRVAWILDRSIPVGGGRRIGLDPLLGLLPGIGDWLGALLSLFVLHEAARLGLPLRVLARMAGNIVVEALAGAVPVLGDLFDFAWQANTRNLHLVDRHYHSGLKPRSLGHIIWAFALFALALLTVVGFIAVAIIRLLAAMLP